MTIFKFKSKASGDIVMMSDHAHSLFKAAGLELPVRGVIEPKDMGRIHANLVAAINTEKMAQQGVEVDESDLSPEEKQILHNRVSLEQRAFPFLKMLQEAEGKQVDIHWGF